MGKINPYHKLLELKMQVSEISTVEMEELVLGFSVMFLIFQWIILNLKFTIEPCQLQKLQIIIML